MKETERKGTEGGKMKKVQSENANKLGQPSQTENGLHQKQRQKKRGCHSIPGGK